MRKPSWSCLGALLMVLMFQASVEVQDCSLPNLCKNRSPVERLVECIRLCSMDSSKILGYNKGIARNELKRTINYSQKKYKQKDIHSGSISSDGGNVNQKRQELIKGDLLNLFSSGVQGEHKEVQGEGMSLIRKARQLGNKNSYSMTHFRWGRTLDLKKQPGNTVKEESADFRRDLPMKLNYPEGSELIVDRRENIRKNIGKDTWKDADKNENKEGSYRMKHFQSERPSLKKEAPELQKGSSHEYEPYRGF